MESMESMYNELNESWWFHGGFCRLQRTRRRAARSWTQTRMTRHVLTNQYEEVQKTRFVCFFLHQFFFRFYAYYLLCLFFFMLFSFTCNSHGLGAVLWGLLSARRRSPRRVCEWHCLFHADSTVATQNSTVTGRIELGYNSFQCAEEQTLLYSFKSPSLRHILRVSLFPTLISVVNLHVLCANEQDPQG
jgi:hypothetical protein